jgi:TPR repeat protein
LLTWIFCSRSLFCLLSPSSDPDLSQPGLEEFQAGFRFERGLDECEKSWKEAFSHYEASAAKGNTDALWKLALCYMWGMNTVRL